MKFPETLHIAFCCDHGMLPGLHAGIAALLSCQTSPVCFWLYLRGLDKKEVQALQETARRSGHPAEVRFVEVDIERYAHFKGLHGSHMIYARLELPKLLPVDRLIYLDSDTLPLVDLRELWETDLQESPLGMITAGTMGEMGDWPLYQEQGFEISHPYYNSGVLLIDLIAWRENRVTERCFEYASQQARRLLTNDQACLNALFGRVIHRLDAKWNLPLYPATEPVGDSFPPALYHFVGSPKPWDIFAFLVHGNHRIFARYFRRSAARSSHWLSYFRRQNYRRARRLWPAYRHCWQERRQAGLRQK